MPGDQDIIESKIAKELMRQLDLRRINFIEFGIFGSRADGTASPESDWDFYAVIEQPQGLMEFTEISNSAAEVLGFPLTTSMRCLFGKDKSRCIDFKFTNKRPVTGKPLITRVKKITYPEGASGDMVLKEVLKEEAV